MPTTSKSYYLITEAGKRYLNIKWGCRKGEHRIRKLDRNWGKNKKWKWIRNIKIVTWTWYTQFRYS